MADDAAWPEFLTKEHSAIHTALENEIKAALAHCHSSADASGLSWTTEGWISCSASNIMGMLRRLGCPPPPVGDVEAVPMPDEGEYLPEDAPAELYDGATEGLAGSGVPDSAQPQTHSRVTLPVPPGTRVQVYGVVMDPAPVDA